MEVTTIGLDIAKNVFQVHGIDASEKVVVRKQLRRGLRQALVSGRLQLRRHHQHRRLRPAAAAQDGCPDHRGSRRHRSWTSPVTSYGRDLPGWVLHHPLVHHFGEALRLALDTPDRVRKLVLESKDSVMKRAGFKVELLGT